MWRLLAEELSKPENKHKNWYKIKKSIYLALGGKNYTSSHCFLCDYVKLSNNYLNCDNGTCPIIWENKKSLQCFNAEYELMKYIGKNQEKSKIAKRISELPRRR